MTGNIFSSSNRRDPVGGFGDGKCGFEGRTVCPRAVGRGWGVSASLQQDFGVAAWILWGPAQPGESRSFVRAVLGHGSVLPGINYINHPPA